MLIYILHSDDVSTFRLPSEVAGDYILTDTDENGKNRSLVNISSVSGKWYFNGTDDISIYYNGSYNSQIEVVPYNFYTICYYNSVNINLYVAPGNETSYIMKCVPGDTTLLVGSDSSCDFIYSSTSLAGKQIQLNYTNGVWNYVNLDKKTPVYLNKKRRDEGIISSFDSLFAMGLRLIFVGNIIVVVFPPQTIHTLPNNLLDVSLNFAVDNNISKEVYKEFYNSGDYFFKSPVFKKKIAEYEIEITAPDVKTKSTNSGLLSQVVPSALMSVTSLISLYFSVTNFGKVAGTGVSSEQLSQNKETLITSAVMCIIMLITGIAWPIIEHIASLIKDKINSVKRVITYNKYLSRKYKELKKELVDEKSALNFNSISLQQCQEAIKMKNSNLFANNVTSNSFLSVRFGIGKVKSLIKFNYKRPDMIVQNDKLYDKIDDLIETGKYIDDVAFVFNIKNSSLAVVDPLNNYDNYLNAILLQLMTLHDYNNLKFVVLTEEGSNLNKIKNLNHCWNNEKTFRYFATNIHEAENISTELMKIVNKNNEKEDIKSIETYYIVVSDCIENYKSLKIIEYILRNTGKNDPKQCMGILMFTNKVNNIPTGCDFFINYSENECSIFNSEMDEDGITKFKPTCIDETINFYSCVEALSDIPITVSLSDGAQGTLPTKLGFLEMYGVGKIEQLNIFDRWKNAPISTTLTAPVGVDAMGDLIYLDLHEKKHGPHGLVAGMTGSGKSEFIVTYILSLAINYSPDEVQFVLIDYKGGGLAGAFENKKNGIRLPHLVGTITNLDKAEMSRTLVSIKSELQRRQRVFNQAKDKLNTGSIDIYKYQVLVRDGSLDEPMSHLFIICDEFAELKAQQPEFMDELVSAARIGRSLGIHLILATQKPTGVVDDQIWSNSKFKVCCKVQSADDSNEMLRKPDAAYIKESGRFYLQVGYDEYYVLGQSGYSGVQYVPSEKIVTNTDNSIDFISNSGDVFRNAVQKAEIENVDNTVKLGEELNNILRYIIGVAESNNYQYHKLWLDNVPDLLYYGNLVKKYTDIKPLPFNICPLVGEYDDPENQSQGSVNLALTGAGNVAIFGAPGAGKYTFISTMIFSSIINHSTKEINFYILDFGSGKFNMFSSAPQVGDILTINDKKKLSYFFYMIEKEISTRQKYYAANGGDFLLDVKNGKAPFPNIVVVVYGAEVFKETYDELYDGIFASITRSCSKVGIEFVLSTSTNGLGLSVEGNIKKKILIQLADETDYQYLIDGARPPSKKPGRGIIAINDIPMEFQTALITTEGTEKQYLDSILVKLKTVILEKAKKVPEVPKKIALADVLPAVTDLTSVPLGVNIFTAQNESFNFNNKVTLMAASRLQNTNKFMSKLSSLLVQCSNNNLIILNSQPEFKFKVDEKAKYYDSDFKKVVKLFYDNCQKLNTNSSDKKFTILIIGYNSINKHLLKLKEEDSTICTLDDFLLSCNNDNFRFLIYENDESISKILNSDISDMIDNSNGIWMGMDYDGQSSFDMMTTYIDSSATNDVILTIKDSQVSYVKYPTI